MIIMLCGLLLGEAEAKKGLQNRPYMYGWGPSVNTMLFPFQYPHSFPIGKDDTTPPNEQLNEMRQDLGFGPKFTMYINKQYRLSAYPYAHLGANQSGYRSVGISLEGDASILIDNNVSVFYGVGGGSNLFTFDQGSSGVVSAQQLYAKGQVGMMYFDRLRAYELALYAKFGWTGVERFEYLDVEYENDVGANDDLKGSLYYPTLGIQGTYYFGDFRKAQGKKKKGKSGKKKSNKSR